MIDAASADRELRQRGERSDTYTARLVDVGMVAWTRFEKRMLVLGQRALSRRLCTVAC